MQVKIGDVRIAVPVLNRIAEESGLKASVAYRLGKALRAFGKELEDFEMERGKLAAKYGNVEKDAEGVEMIKVSDPEKLKLFSEEIRDLLTAEIDVPVSKFKPEDFEGAHLSAQHFIALEFMIAEE